jgi:HK97 family phage portal protein
MFNFSSSKEVKALQRQVLQLTQAATIANIGSVFSTALASYPDWSIVSNASRYSTSDDIYSIIQTISRTAVTIPFYGYEITDDKALRHLKNLSLKVPIRTRKTYQEKALEDLPDGDPINDLLEDPFLGFNKYDGWEAIYITLLTQGEVFLYKFRPELGVNAGRTQKLGFMYPQYTVLKVTQTYPKEVVGYDYIVDGTVIRANIPVNDVIHIKFFNPQLPTTPDQFRGLSPLKVLTRRLTRIDKALTTSVSQLQNGGVPGIVYNKTPGVSVETSTARRDNFLKYLTNETNTGAPYFAADELGYLEIGLSLVDMDVAALDKIDFKKLCNAYGISDRLLNNDATGSEVSDDNARKALYLNAVLPMVTRISEALNKGLLEDFKDKKRFISPDITEVPELQSDMKEMASILSTLPIMVPNNILEAFNYGRIDDEIMDKVYVKSGYTALEDIQPVADIPDDDEGEII